MAPKPKYISLKKAMEITGRDTYDKLRCFIKSYNRDNLDAPIWCIPGYVEENSLIHALDRHARKHTPGLEIRGAIASGALRR